MLKAGLIGTGTIGNVHSAVYSKLEGVKLAAIADINTPAAEKTAALHGAKVYSSLEELLDKEKPDMVDICTPTHTHAELAVKALDRKVHVLCEKPMSIDMDSALKMAEAAKRNGKYLMIAQVIRFWPEYAYLKKIYEDGIYGRLLEAYFKRVGESPEWGNWFSDPVKSGLSPLDLHVHDTDFILYMLGRPGSVSSFGMPDEVKNNFLSTRYHYDGICVEAETGWYSAPIPFEMSYRAVFEKAVVYYREGKLTLYPAGGQPRDICPGDGNIPDTGINVGSTDAYFNEIKYFTDCIKNNVLPSASSPESTLGSLETVFKEIESARTGKTIEL